MNEKNEKEKTNQTVEKKLLLRIMMPGNFSFCSKEMHQVFFLPQYRPKYSNSVGNIKSSLNRSAIEFFIRFQNLTSPSALMR